MSKEIAQEYQKGRIALLCYDYAQAEQKFWDVLVQLRGREDELSTILRAKTFTLLGETLFRTESFEIAESLFEESEALFAKFKFCREDLYSRAMNNYLRGEICMAYEEKEKAAEHFEAAVPFVIRVFHETHPYRERMQELLGDELYLRATLRKTGNEDNARSTRPLYRSGPAFRYAENLEACLRNGAALLESGEVEKAFEAFADALYYSSYSSSHMGSDAQLISWQLSKLSMQIGFEKLSKILCNAAITIMQNVSEKESMVTASDSVLLQSALEESSASDSDADNLETPEILQMLWEFKKVA